MSDRPDRDETVRRGLLIGVMTFVCVGVSLVVGMAVHQTFLPETDGAKHALFFGLLNPFVLMIAIPIAGLAGLVACPFAIFLLLRTRLEISIPVVFVSTVAGAAIGAAVHVFIAALSGLAIGGGAMMVCNLIFHEGRGRARPA